MATMGTEVYDALIDVGASEEKAHREFSDIRGELKVLKAMNGVAIAGIVAILLRLFIH